MACVLGLLLALPGLGHCQTCCADSDSIVSTFAGTGVSGYSGDGGPANTATLSTPWSVVLDAAGNLYIADYGNNVVRMVSPGGIISTFAGNGTSGHSGDGGPATAAALSAPTFLAFDSSGNLYISDGYTEIREVTPGGIISRFAGNGTLGYTGDGGAATAAEINCYDLAVDPYNNVVFTDANDHVIRKVSTGGTISTIAGNGTRGYSGDGGPATAAELNAPEGVVFDNGAGSIYFWDDLNYYVRKIDSCGVISTVAGNGVGSESGDGGPALGAGFADSEGLAFCGGNLYLSDWPTGTVRMINSCGNINLVGGVISADSDTGDGGPFSAATFDESEGIVFDPSGDLYLADLGNNKVRLISKDCAPSPTPACTVLPTASPACTKAAVPGTPTPTPSITTTSTPSGTPSNSGTPTPSASPSATATNSPTATLSPTMSVSPTHTLSSTVTPTFSPTPLPLLLTPHYPNPNPAGSEGIWLPYTISTPAWVDLEVFDVAGEKVRSFDTDPDFEAAGDHERYWDLRNSSGTQVASGIFLVRIHARSPRNEQASVWEKCAVVR